MFWSTRNFYQVNMNSNIVMHKYIIVSPPTSPPKTRDGPARKRITESTQIYILASLPTSLPKAKVDSQDLLKMIRPFCNSLKKQVFDCQLTQLLSEKINFLSILQIQAQGQNRMFSILFFFGLGPYFGATCFLFNLLYPAQKGR